MSQNIMKEEVYIELKKDTIKLTLQSQPEER
ncbi:uncharacterized protein METZ01_LOCUS204068, partial [marine metagenome]